MKRFADFSAIAFSLLILSTSGVKALEINREKLIMASASSTILIAQAETNSQFVTVEKEHPTTGTLKVIEENGKQYLEFEDDFRTVEGPAVKIVLHKNDTVPVNIKEENYISIASIQNFEGTQRYEVPEGIDLDEYASVAVWCEDFNITFGYAQVQN